MPRLAFDALCIALVAVLSLGGLLPTLLSVIVVLALLALYRRQARERRPDSLIARLGWPDFVAIAVLGPVGGFALGALVFAAGPGV